MILRVLEDRSPQVSTPKEAGSSASHVFISTEKSIHPPCVIVLQVDHSRLAGDLARALSSEPFGRFPVEVIEAAAQHDLGWAESDASQMQRLGSTSPRPFPCLSVAETQPAFNACVQHGRSSSPLTDVLISRHFTALAGHDRDRQPFVTDEISRREKLEAQLPHSTDDLERWADILGFCDLLSLYLCCGVRQTVEFPLAHPASERSKDALKVTLSWSGDKPKFSRPVVKDGAAVTLSGSIYQGTTSRITPIDYTWAFA